MESIDLSKLNEIPYIKKDLTPDHLIVCLSFYVDSNWNCWIPFDNKIIKSQMWPVEANYFGDKKEKELDQFYELLNLMAQITLNEKIYSKFNALNNDFFGMGAALAKYKMFYENRNNKDYGIERLVQSELENTVSLCRSVFDILQEIINYHFSITKFNGVKSTNKLPDSFAKVALKGDECVPATEIVKKYCIPDLFAEWYVQYQDFFKKLRDIRNLIQHRGHTIKTVFSTDKGFAVDKNEDPFKGIYKWHVDCELPNSLVPIRPVIAKIVSKTIEATNTFAVTFKKCIKLPDEFAPNLKLYTRGTNDKMLSGLDRVIQESVWDDDLV